MKRTSVLVTGGAGFIGSHLTRRLLQDGCTVRVVDNLSTGFRRNLDEVWDNIEFLEGDVEDSLVAGAAAEGVDIVYHLAALPSVPRSMKDPIATHRANVNGTLQLLEASRRAGVRRFVYSSSSSAYGDTEVLPKAESAEPLPRSPYAASKVAGELYTLSYARAGMIEGVALRYFNVFGPRQDPNGPYAAVIPLIFRAAINGVPLTIYGDGEQTRDFTYVDNVVEGNVLAGTGSASRVNGHCVNLGAGSRLSLLELVRLVEEVVGQPVQRHHAPPRAGDVRDSQAHLERARTVLGYSPRVTVREGITRLWEWYKSDPSVAMTAA
jgi:UDP-N-acetylglucosamine/UDP-N-acetyl-alpha-D-glucosaminouronate 4-epimerase